MSPEIAALAGERQELIEALEQCARVLADSSCKDPRCLEHRHQREQASAKTRALALVAKARRR